MHGMNNMKKEKKYELTSNFKGALAMLKSNYVLRGNRTSYVVNRYISLQNQVDQLGLNECGLNLTSQCN
jgi:hypothetical protein